MTGRPQLTDVDREVIGSRPAEVQAGAVSIRTRYIGECAAAGWATLGAGRRTTVDGLCSPEVVNGAVNGWDGFLAAAAARRGDARLGTLAAATSGCVAAVGPGAALAAARPDGTLAAYATVDEFIGRGLATTCPITLVDAGDRSDEVIDALADDDTRTLIVTGIGPAPGSDDPAPAGLLPGRHHVPGLGHVGQHPAERDRHPDRPHPHPCRFRRRPGRTGGRDHRRLAAGGGPGDHHARRGRRPSGRRGRPVRRHPRRIRRARQPGRPPGRPWGWSGRSAAMPGLVRGAATVGSALPGAMLLDRHRCPGSTATGRC